MVLSGPGNDAATGATHACAASAAPSSLPPPFCVLDAIVITVNPCHQRDSVVLAQRE
jgi:hypothetical protein